MTQLDQRPELNSQIVEVAKNILELYASTTPGGWVGYSTEGKEVRIVTHGGRELAAVGEGENFEAKFTDSNENSTNITSRGTDLPQENSVRTILKSLTDMRQSIQDQVAADEWFNNALSGMRASFPSES